MPSGVRVTGLTALVRDLKGPAFKDVNRELRTVAKQIATDLVPVVSEAVAQSGAPQAKAMSRTVRPKSDRVPVVVIGAVYPRFAGGGFRRRGESPADAKKRRGAMAHGVLFGPKGGRRDTRAAENYYRIARNSTGGPVGRSLNSGPAGDKAREVYLREYLAVLRRHGFTVKKGGFL